MRRLLIQSPTFVRAAKRLLKKDPSAAAAIRETLERLEIDAFDPRLRTHKLKGELKGRWASSAGYDIRVVFHLGEEAGAEAVILLSIGTHDEVH